MTPLRILFTPNGRIRRRTYWGYSLGMTFLSLSLQYLLSKLLGTGNFNKDGISALTGPITSLTISRWILLVIFLWPTYCVAIKRWQDRNKAVWIMIIYYAISYGKFIAYRYYGVQFNNPVILTYGIVSVLFGLWLFIECGLLDGTQGPNKYGPSPKGITGHEAKPEQVI